MRAIGEGRRAAGMLELDDAPLQADDRRVRPVVGVEFRKDALDPPLDGVLRNVELIPNLLVRVSGRDEAQHDDFGWCQGLIIHVLGDLARASNWVVPETGNTQLVRADYVERMVAFDVDADNRIIAMISMEPMDRDRRRLARGL